MYKNIFIIGAGRVGKTTLSKMINKKFGYSIVSIDDIVTALEAFPELKLSRKTDHQTKSNKITNFLKKYLKELSEGNKFYDGFKTVIEGTAVDLENLIPAIDQNKCLLIGLTYNKISKEDLFNAVRKYDTEDDWTYYLSDEELLNFCSECIEINREFSKKFEEFNIITYDTSLNRQEALTEILKNIEEYCKP